MAERKDPFKDSEHYFRTDSTIALAGHPIHAMAVAFPIALSFGTLGGDLFYWWTGDPFWARLSLWSIGFAFWVGVLAGLTGMGEMVFGPGLRRRIAVWTHFIAAVACLSVYGANWGVRYAVPNPADAVLPWGLLLSILGAMLTGLTGWHGGKLVFEHQIGVNSDS